jgi:hypothetical protein
MNTHKTNATCEMNFIPTFFMITDFQVVPFTVKAQRRDAEGELRMKR